MRPALLSNMSSTDARPTGLRSPAPLKITSCIDSPRSAEAFDSPSTQRTASITLDLPQPFGPTMPTSCPGVPMEVGSTKDLNPDSLICVRRTEALDRLWQDGRRHARRKREIIAEMTVPPVPHVPPRSPGLPPGASVRQARSIVFRPEA